MLSKSVQNVLRDALIEVQRRRHELLTVEHILFAMTNSMKGRIILEGSGASVAMLREQLEGFFRQEMQTLEQPQSFEVTQTVSVQRVLERALAHIHSAGKDTVEIGDLLVSIMEEEGYAEYFLKRQGVERLDVLTFISHGLDSEREDGDGSEQAQNGDKETSEKDALEKYAQELAGIKNLIAPLRSCSGDARIIRSMWVSLAWARQPWLKVWPYVLLRARCRRCF